MTQFDQSQFIHFTLPTTDINTAAVRYQYTLPGLDDRYQTINDRALVTHNINLSDISGMMKCCPDR